MSKTSDGTGTVHEPMRFGFPVAVTRRALCGRVRRHTWWVLVLLLCGACAAEKPQTRQAAGWSEYVDGQHSFVPEDGYIPDSQTAERVAEAILVAIYGETVIAQQKPLVADLQGGQWHVSGTLPEGYLGGVATVVLSQFDGCVLRVSHSL